MIVVLMMVGVVLVLEPPTSTPRKLLLSETSSTEGLFHIIMSAHNIHYVLVMGMVKVVWFLGPPTTPPRNFIAGLVVAILWHIRVGHLS